MPNQEKRTEAVTFWMTQGERAILVRMALAEDRSLSGMVRRAVIEAGKERGMTVETKEASDGTAD